MTELLPPPPGVYVRDRHTGAVWLPEDSTGAVWHAHVAGRLMRRRWEDLASGTFGDLDMLVPIPYSTDVGNDSEVLRQLAQNVTTPVANMIGQLVQSATTAITVSLAEAYRFGRQAARQAPKPGARAADDAGVMGTLATCDMCKGDGLVHVPDAVPPGPPPAPPAAPKPAPVDEPPLATSTRVALCAPGTIHPGAVVLAPVRPAAPPTDATLVDANPPGPAAGG